MDLTWNDWSIILVKNIVNPIWLQEPVPWERGKFNYIANGSVTIEDTEGQVSGSLSRYNHPKFKNIQYDLKNKIGKIIGDPVYPSYYYDRFYFKNQELTEHVDRPACEVSMSLHCSNNLDYEWPIWFTDPEGKNIPLVTNPGDGVIYKGCERPHWREPMKGDHKSYYHQVFFHYVRRDGPYLEHASDNVAKISHK